MPHPVAGVGVVGHVEEDPHRHDRRVVHDIRGELDERAVPGTRDGAGLELLQREPVRAWFRDPGRAEVQHAGEVRHPGPNRFCRGVGLVSVTVCTAAGSPIAMLASFGA